MKTPDTFSPAEDDEADDGGSAFPLRIEFPTTGPQHVLGMTLRDYFAGQMLAGVVTAAAEAQLSADTIATGAYHYADAMLRARRKVRQ